MYLFKGEHLSATAHNVQSGTELSSSYVDQTLKNTKMAFRTPQITLLLIAVEAGCSDWCIPRFREFSKEMRLPVPSPISLYPEYALSYSCKLQCEYE